MVFKMEDSINRVIYLIYDSRGVLSDKEQLLKQKSIDILEFILRIDNTLIKTLDDLSKTIKESKDCLWTRNSLHDILKEKHIDSYFDYIKKLRVLRYMNRIKRRN